MDELRTMDLAEEAQRYGLMYSFLLHALLVGGDCVDLTPFADGAPLGQLTTVGVYCSDTRRQWTAGSQWASKPHGPGCQHLRNLRGDDDLLALGEWVEPLSAAGESAWSRDAGVCSSCGGFAIRRLDVAELYYWRAVHEVYEATKAIETCEQHLAGVCEPGRRSRRRGTTSRLSSAGRATRSASGARISPASRATPGCSSRSTRWPGSTWRRCASRPAAATRKAVLPAAGLPWFLTLFGRDTIITGYQTLTVGPSLARGALVELAAFQGSECDDFKDEEPGKILHEVRTGELTQLGLRPHNPYYGTADATPLWLILLSEYWRWTADNALVRSMRDNVQAALDWIDLHGDRDGDGYVEYQTRSPQGLGNQCWRDS
jgi:hypothetical protein